jgi:DNA polymerase V
MDCNNFFVSCERLFRPDLKNQPVAVLSSNDGCIVARSQEVKDMGIPMGLPYFKLKDFCDEKDITLFSSNFTLYRDISGRVMQALREECGECEIYSIDEAFFDLDENVDESVIKEIRATIIKKTGIPVSIGVASTKTLAKVANSVAKKKSGVFILNNDKRVELLQNITCGSVWGIGRHTSARLLKDNITTVADFLALEQSYVRSVLGVVGERLYLELSGVAVYEVGRVEEHLQESYTSSRSFGSTTHDKVVLQSALSYHVAHLAEKLRKDSSLASTVSILIRGSRYGTYTHRSGHTSAILPIPTNDTFILTKGVLSLFEKSYDPEIPYKKAGVTLGGIHPESVAHESLFGTNEHSSKTRILNTVIDAINAKKGTHILKFGVSLNSEKWKEKRALKSKEYTTKWSEIANVKAT